MPHLWWSRVQDYDDDKEKRVMNDQRPSPPRRAHLDQHGNAVTFTDTGAIINGLEIIYEPTRDEASREVGARQRAHMLAGVETHEVLRTALGEVAPVYRHAYMR
jgi:hypothetical protein